MADPRPDVDVLLTEGLGDQAFYTNERELTEGHFNQRLDLAIHHLGSLIEDARTQTRYLPVDEVTNANIDSDGNATFPVYQVGAGFLLEIGYFVIEFDGYTPAAPYSQAGFYLEMRSSPNPNAAGTLGSLIDFLPVTNGLQAIPAVAGYTQPRLVRSQQWVVCKIVLGPASKRCSVRMGAWLRSNG